MKKKKKLNNISMTLYFDKTLDLLNDRTIKLGENVLHDSEYVESFSASSSILDDVKKHSVFAESSKYIQEILQNLTNNKLLLHSRQRFFLKMNYVSTSSLLENVNLIFTNHQKSFQEMIIY